MIRDLKKRIITENKVNGTLMTSLISGTSAAGEAFREIRLSDIIGRAIARILPLEGGYVNDPDDSGGETIFGITRKNFPSLKLWNIVDRTDNKKTIKLKDHMTEVTMVYSKFNPIQYMTEFTLDEFIGLYAFAINAGLGTVKRIFEEYGKYNQSNSGKWKLAIVSHYNRLLKVPKNKKFRKSWQRRLTETFKDENMKLEED